MTELTDEQRAAVESRGKVIVSASAGSGKTFVMIEKLTRAIEDGADLDSVLAVTFTKKAAAQMKEKLRSALIKKLDGADEIQKKRIKTQISGIASADISTIHAFCARLLRTHFYALGIDGGFDIMPDDDPVAQDLKERALENLFERGYENADGAFLHLVKRFSKKRSDGALKKLLLESYSKVRNVSHYRAALENTEKLYTDEGFNAVCNELKEIFSREYVAIEKSVREFALSFPQTGSAATYSRIFAEMQAAASQSAASGLFAPRIPFTSTAKPRDREEDMEAGELFKNFRDGAAKRYNSVREGIADEDSERAAFLESGETAKAFSRLLLDFDGEYSRIKQDENKLDYNDLEHLTLELLQDEDIKKEINSKYRYVFVDEYQDVNPVQEEIISAMEGEVFLVGDIKQAIYGFRGSKSLFFAEKYNRFAGGGGSALHLTGNFRSCGNVLGFVNGLFSDVMREETCGFDYAAHSRMTAGGAYPADCGGADIIVFGKEEKPATEKKVYSVLENSRPAPHTREGLAVLKIVEKELACKRYDLEKKEYVDVQAGDICILTRKNAGGQAEGIVRALRDAGYAVAGAQDINICTLPEVKQVIDILSLIDNAEQDIPLVTALLSPIGGFSEDEAAAIRIAFRREGRISFRKCCRLYLENVRGEIALKLENFYKKLNTFRQLAQILTAEELIEALLESGLEAAYSSGGGEKLKNVLRLAAEGKKLSLPAFLARLKTGGYTIKAPAAAPSDSITVMTMHAAKGLEFPIVILADICRTFKGSEAEVLPFDDEYGFAPKCYDTQKMLVRSTLLRKLVKLRADREELKNELNLFYVACTRAMCRLHVLASDIPAYSADGALRAKCYAQTFDINKFGWTSLTPSEPESGGGEIEMALPADSAIAEAVASRFMRRYTYEDSVELPVKSSASAIIKSIREDEPYFAENELFKAESAPDGTGAERGTAYHRFLELCDFSLKSAAEVQKEIENFTREGKMTAEQASLVSAEQLSQILNMPVFDGLAGAELYREREFLCRLKAKDVLNTSAGDYVLLQGAIDLMACTGGAVRIIDYKYSKKTDGELISTYSAQLSLYKKAVSAILHIPETSISTAIVNIYACRQIILS